MSVQPGGDAISCRVSELSEQLDCSLCRACNAMEALLFFVEDVPRYCPTRLAYRYDNGFCGSFSCARARAKFMKNASRMHLQKLTWLKINWFKVKVFIISRRVWSLAKSRVQKLKRVSETSFYATLHCK